MSHFEEFDRRKAQTTIRLADDCRDCFVHYRHGGPSPWTCPECGRQWIVRNSTWVPLNDEERNLQKAYNALVLCLPVGEARVERIRDEVWEVGVDLYGWSE